MTDENLVIPILGTSLMVVLAFDDAGGQVRSKQLLTKHFDTMHRDVASELLRYHKQYKRAPKGHFYELFSTKLARNDDDKLLKQVLESIVDAAKHLNVVFVVEKVNTFLRRQRAASQSSLIYGKQARGVAMKPTLTMPRRLQLS